MKLTTDDAHSEILSLLKAKKAPAVEDPSHEMSPEVLKTLMDNLSKYDHGLIQDLSEWLVERYGGEVQMPSPGVVRVTPAEEWANEFKPAPFLIKKPIQDWVVMSDPDDKHTHESLENYQFELQETSDGVYFSVYPSRVNALKEVGDLYAYGVGLFGKIEISGGFPTLSVSRDMESSTAIISPSSVDGLFIALDKDVRVDSGSSVSQHHDEFQQNIVLGDGIDANDLLEEGRSTNLAWTIFNLPSYRSTHEDFKAFLAYLTSHVTSVDTNELSITLPVSEGSEYQEVYHATFHPLKIAISDISHQRDRLNPELSHHSKPSL